MQLFRRPRTAAGPVLPGSVATIGVFDGVHLGHQRIIGRVVGSARQRRLPAVVFSFEPTPQEFFSPDRPPPRLTRLREKVEVLRGLGVDVLFCPPFDRAMEQLGPDEFMDHFLARTLAVRHLVVGDDFRFANGRSGTISHLQSGGQRLGFGVEQVDSVTADGVRVSSTAVRRALAEGDLSAARRWLGRWYGMDGRVVAGRRLGRELGYPTANVQLKRRASPLSGIFAVRVHGAADEVLDGVASLGTRPTVTAGEPLLEVHIFDFDRDIYGRRIRVDFVARLRDEVRFPDLGSLRRQMDLDAAEARRLLAAAPA